MSVSHAESAWQLWIRKFLHCPKMSENTMCSDGGDLDMAEINLPDSERAAIRAIDENVLRALIDKATQDGYADEMHRLPLSGCGPYVTSKLHYFFDALTRYRDAKSAKNRALRAGDDLSFAVMQMKHRLKIDEKDRETFRIDDNILSPWRFGRNLDVRVSFSWRRSGDDEWQHGSIVFNHDVRPRYVVDPSPPKRKPSAAKQAQQLQDELASIWEQLKRSALYSVRDFFRNGGDGKDIPASFQAVPDAHGGHLNNYSTIFWKTKSSGSRGVG